MGSWAQVFLEEHNPRQLPESKQPQAVMPPADMPTIEGKSHISIKRGSGADGSTKTHARTAGSELDAPCNQMPG